MGMFSSASRAITSVFDTITDVAGTANESVSMATTYVHNRAVSQKLTDKQEVMVSTAEKMTELQAKLDADDKLKAQYDKLEAEFA